ncbi:magnesium chelatase [Salinigranum rubrum]|uniref:Magnesium chelatase n=1 Tax=Salinigranum rubrum TaxID=755307 RepID=A0A2I8VLP0_9EURY|nr:MoxR family ATPase [Salinigranum rubrum]AUV82853.1 magnesium chelatase [Salinigranum rubrum]
MTHAETLYEALCAEMSKVLIGNEPVVEGLTVALLTRGHVLVEGIPGVAKTTIANLFAIAMGLEYHRIQMTPDMLPADVTGSEVYDQRTSEFTIRPGPVFANIVLADEINRATPKTQSALLEAMQERQVTIGGETRRLPDPFMLIATQNPIEMEGTFRLPKAQNDRFQQKLIVEVLKGQDELDLINRFDDTPQLGPEAVSAVVTMADVRRAQREVEAIHVSDRLKEYILALVDATREHPDIEYGTSSRTTLAFLSTSKAYAAIDGRDYVVPDDVIRLAPSILRHRLTLSSEAELDGVTPEEIIDEIVSTVPVPGDAEDVPHDSLTSPSES